MMEFGQPQRIACAHPILWGALILAVSMGCVGTVKSRTEMRDVEVFPQNSQAYVAKAQEDLAALQAKLRQDNGERANTLIRLAQSCCIVGELAEADKRLDYFEKGKYYAELLIRFACTPSRVIGLMYRDFVQSIQDILMPYSDCLATLISFQECLVYIFCIACVHFGNCGFYGQSLSQRSLLISVPLFSTTPWAILASSRSLNMCCSR